MRPVRQDPQWEVETFLLLVSTQGPPGLGDGPLEEAPHVTAGAAQLAAAEDSAAGEGAARRGRRPRRADEAGRAPGRKGPLTLLTSSHYSSELHVTP